MIDYWEAQLAQIVSKTSFWLTVSTVAAWLSLVLSLTAAVILILKFKEENNG